MQTQIHQDCGNERAERRVRTRSALFQINNELRNPRLNLEPLEERAAQLEELEWRFKAAKT